MYHFIYQLNEMPDAERTDADFLSDHPLLMNPGMTVDDVKGEERDKSIDEFGKWLLSEGLGDCENETVKLSFDASCGKHFADRYERFREIAESIARITKETYCHCYRNVQAMVSDLAKAITDEDDDYVCVGMSCLYPMDEFIRMADPQKLYYIGAVCKYHR